MYKNIKKSLPLILVLAFMPFKYCGCEQPSTFSSTIPPENTNPY